MSNSQSNEYLSSNSPGNYGSDYNRLRFVINSLLAKVRTSVPVRVEAVTNNGGVSPIGYVDIQPLVGQLDGNGNMIPHGVIYNVPYLRIQGGNNAVIIDPEVGDIGLAAFSDRDISSVKATSKVAPPGSKRRHDMSDAVYLHSIIANAPTQYIQFQGTKITVHSPQSVNVECQVATIDAPTTHMTGNLQVDGNIVANGDISDHTNKSMAGMRSTYNGHTHNDPQGGTVAAPNQPM